MSTHLIDANVLLDIATADPKWMNWSREQIRLASTNGTIAINPIIYAEIAPAFATASDLDAWVGTNVFARLPLPYAAGWMAAQAFIAYRRAGGTRTTPLPDFYIGAHALTDGLVLITRDVARYQTYFPGIRLITP